MKSLTLSDIFALVFFIFFCLMIGIISSAFMQDSLISWYPNLIMSELTPPSEVFMPVWTLLYTIMGIAFWSVWGHRTNPAFPWASILFFTGLFLNAIWSFCFFYLQNPLLGLVDLIGLDFIAVLTTIFFFKVSRMAGILMLPYLAWISFATYLNAFILVAN